MAAPPAPPGAPAGASFGCTRPPLVLSHKRHALRALGAPPYSGCFATKECAYGS